MTAPRWYSLYVELAATAERLLADRERGDPVFVGTGSLTVDQAKARLRIMQAIVADWQAARDGLPLPNPEQATQAEKRDTLEQAATRAAQLAAADPKNRSRADYAELVETLLWQQQDWHGTSRVRWFHQLTLDMRAESTARLSPSPLGGPGDPGNRLAAGGEGLSTHAQAA